MGRMLLFFYPAMHENESKWQALRRVPKTLCAAEGRALLFSLQDGARRTCCSLEYNTIASRECQQLGNACTHKVMECWIFKKFEIILSWLQKPQLSGLTIPRALNPSSAIGGLLFLLSGLPEWKLQKARFFWVCSITGKPANQAHSSVCWKSKNHPPETAGLHFPCRVVALTL